jgi:hypothetical protein
MRVIFYVRVDQIAHISLVHARLHQVRNEILVEDQIALVAHAGDATSLALLDLQRDIQTPAVVAEAMTAC